MPAKCETAELPSHHFQIFNGLRAGRASGKMLLVHKGIRPVQFAIEKGVENEFPFRTGPSLAPGRDRLDGGKTFEVPERRPRFAPNRGLVESRLYQLHLRPRV
jgi:hypothetical protein